MVHVHPAERDRALAVSGGGVLLGLHDVVGRTGSTEHGGEELTFKASKDCEDLVTPSERGWRSWRSWRHWRN
jgi:hypothetical protein